MKTERRETIGLMLLVFAALLALVHWSPALRSTWDFLPAEWRGDVNDFVSIWVAEFAHTVRSMPFWHTFWFVNLRGTSQSVYSSHPGFLTFLLSVWELVWGESPFSVRTLAMALFAIRVGVLFSLARDWLGRRGAWLTVLLYLCVPATLAYSHALSFEVEASTFALAAFWAPARWAGVFFACAVCTDWTALLALPFLVWATPSRRWAPVCWGLGAFLVSWFWTQHFVVSPEAGHFLSRVHDFLVGPFYVLPSNPGARALLLYRVLESFPLFLLVPFVFDLWRRKGRPRWATAMLVAGGLLLLGFLGVFRVHAYLSSMVVLGMAPAAARAWLSWWSERRFVLGLGTLAASLLMLPMIPPWRSTENAELRRVYAAEAMEASPAVAGKSYRLIENDEFLRPQPLAVY